MVEVFDDLGETSLSAVVYLYLSDTAVRLPPGILMPGHTYVFVVEARHCPGIEVEQSPLRFAIPYAKVPAVTALVTP